MTQEKALAILKSGRNVFLTGSAGTGKTYVLNAYIKYLQERKIRVAVTASTGIAATHLNGMTIHAWSGIGVKNHLNLNHLQSLRERKYMRDKMDDVAVLIIDEISMLHRNQLGMVDEVLQYFKENTLPFGGIQVVFSGDFFQLPPIGNQMESSREKFCFMSNSWVRADLQVCYLQKQFRQSSNELNFLLQEIRNGEVSESAVQLLEEKVQQSLYEDEEIFPQLYTHNLDVDRINEFKINEIDSPQRKFKATLKGNKTLRENMSKSILAPENLILKEGAEVMFVRNNWEEGYFNGTLGVVKEFTEKGFPLVETKNGEWIEARSETWNIEDEKGKVLASFTQVPLRLAWAITVHKSQGMTLDSATIDLRKTFEKGQGYVALSRLRDMDGLRLKGVNPMVMELDELARKADTRFIEISNQIDNQLSIGDLERDFKAFIIRNNGTLDTSEIQKAKHKRETKNKKKATHLITKELLDQGLSLEEIAEERGYVISTILGHFYKIKNEFPETDFSFLNINEEIIENVKMALEKSDNSPEETSLKFIYEVNNGKITYDKIRRALLFVD